MGVTLERPRRPSGPAILRFAVAGLTSLLVVALAGLVVVEVRPGWLAGLRNATTPSARGRPAATTPVPTVRPGTTNGATHRRSSGRSSGRSPTGSGAAPVLASLLPDVGRPGQQLSLTGANLFSTDGTIVVTFAGHAAPVRCPTNRSCVVTVPHLAGPARSTAVEMRTSGGRSNVLTFSYRA